MITVRHASLADAKALADLDAAVWGKDKAAPEEMMQARLERFAHGVLIAESDEGKIVGSACSHRIKGFDPDAELSWWGCSGEGVFGNHERDGETAFGINISTLASQPRGVGTKLIEETLRRIVVGGNCARGVVGCRFAGWSEYKLKNSNEFGTPTPEEYLGLRDGSGRCLDPHVRLFADIVVDGVPFVPVRLLPNYYEDPDSENYGVLCMWMNPHWAPGKPSKY